MIFVGKLFPMSKFDRFLYRRLYRAMRCFYDVCESRRIVFGIIMRNHIGKEVLEVLDR